MKYFFQLILLLLVISTVCICRIKPNMHKTFFVYNSDYKIVSEDISTKTVEEVPMAEIKVTLPETKVKKIEEKNIQETPRIAVTVQTQTVKKSPVTEQKNTKKVNPSINTTTKTVKIVRTPKTQQTTERTSQSVATSTTTGTKSITKETAEKPTVQVEQKTLTNEEIDIAWNVWRSNLQNSIMSNVKLPIMPHGIIFKFTFNVDKYGRISNVQTWADNASYTPYAIQYIAPVIRSYQGKSILNFPAGSKRTITQVNGAWKISDKQEFSTPQDYNDIEKVLK